MAKKAIATEYIQLAASADGIGKSINDAMKGVGSNASSSFAAGFGSTIGNMAFGALSTAGSALKDFASSTIDTGKQFDSSMAQVAATMGKTTAELEGEIGSVKTDFGDFNGTIREFAQFMGANTAFSASQAADALNYMALAGYDTQKSMEMLPNVLNLAAAGSMDLARASDMVTDAETALGLKGNEASVMIDQMAKTASTTNTSVEQLGDAILTIGGTAQFMAGGTEELNAVLGVLADNGIKGTEAGTHLRNMLLKLSSPTEAGANALKDLGVKVYDAEGKMRDFESIFGDLSVAMADFTDEEKIQTFSKLFNTRDVAAATALLGTNAQRWAEVKGAIDGASGSASQMAETQLDNLAGDMTIFQSALEGAQIVVSDQLTPSLREFVQFGTSGIQNITEGFQSGGLEGAMSALGETIGQGLELAIKKAPNIMNAAFSLVTSLTTAVMQNLPTIMQTGLTILTNLVKSITENIPVIVPQLVQTLVSVAQVLVDNLPTLLFGVMEMVRALATSLLTDGLPILVEALPDLITGIVGFVLEFSAEFTELVFDIIDIILSEFPTILMQLCANLPAIITGIVQAVLKFAPQLGAAIVDLTIQSLLVLPIIIAELIAALPTIFTSLFNGFKKYWPDMKQSAIDTFEEFISGASGPTILQDTAKAVATVIAEAIKAIKEKIEGFKEAGKDLMNGLINGINDKINDVRNALSNLGNSIKDHFTAAMKIGSPSKVFAEYGGYIDEGLANGINGGVRMVDNAVSTLANATVSPFSRSMNYSIPNISGYGAAPQPALAGAGAGGGITVIEPIYLGTEKIDELVLRVTQDHVYRSGGR